MRKLTLFFVLLIAFVFRFNNINWDSNYHLHPDERFLTMVSTDMRLPMSISEYLDPAVSTFNPANSNYKFFVYGTFPLVLNKILAIALQNDTYTLLTLQGRALSATFDLITLLFIFKIAELLFQRKDSKRSYLAFYAAFFYAIAVLPIQLSHFFAVDTFLTAFMTASFYFALRFFYKGGLFSIIMSAVFLGFAVGSKINGILILPLNMFFVMLRFVQHFYMLEKHMRQRYVWQILGKLLVFGGIFAVTVRFADPYYFATGDLFDWRISQSFVDSIKALKSFEGPDVWYPPAVQWMSKPPVTFSLVNMMVFGVGIPYFILFVIGVFTILKKGLRVITRYFSKDKAVRVEKSTLVLFVVFGWVLAFFLYQSTQFVKALRYFIFLYPFIAIFAAVGFAYIINIFHKKNDEEIDMKIEQHASHYDLDLKENFNSHLKSLLLKGVLLFLVLLWPLAFSSIYLHKTTRIEASEWIYKDIPDQSVILWESWDDPLPLQVPQQNGKFFQGISMPVFDPDSQMKWKQIGDLMVQGDYYILSSNRAWGSIPTVPKKYPQTSIFYQDLLQDKLEYKKIKEFTSYPRIKIFGWEIALPDDWADETFTVYDHPKVMIFKNNTKE